jgi:hypothetical protein
VETWVGKEIDPNTVLPGLPLPVPDILDPAMG